MNLREELINLLQEKNHQIDLQSDLNRSLIQSGIIDSLGLFNLAVWVEEKTGHEIDVTSLDIGREWDSVDLILSFIEAQRGRT